MENTLYDEWANLVDRASDVGLTGIAQLSVWDKLARVYTWALFYAEA